MVSNCSDCRLIVYIPRRSIRSGMLALPSTQSMISPPVRSGWPSQPLSTCERSTYGPNALASAPLTATVYSPLRGARRASDTGCSPSVRATSCSPSNSDSCPRSAPLRLKLTSSRSPISSW